MSLIEAIPEHMRLGLLIELKRWAGEDTTSSTMEVIKRRQAEKEKEMSRIKFLLENNLPLTVENLSEKIENLKEDAISGVVVSQNKKKPLKQP